MAGLKVWIVPGIFEMLVEKITIIKVSEINIDELLGHSVFLLAKHLLEISAH